MITFGDEPNEKHFIDSGHQAGQGTRWARTLGVSGRAMGQGARWAKAMGGPGLQVDVGPRHQVGQGNRWAKAQSETLEFRDSIHYRTLKTDYSAVRRRFV